MSISRQDGLTSSPLRFVALAAGFLAGLALVGCSSGCGSKLPPEPRIQPEDSAPSWSPDGLSVAYVHFNPDFHDTTEPSGLYVVDAAGTTKRLIVPGFYGTSLARSVDWSPDGRWLVYNDGMGLHLITATGDSARHIYSGGSFPAWSPDGSEIAFSTIARVWAIRPDGTGLHPLTPLSLPAAGDADWSPDGERIVMLGNNGSVGEEVFVFRLADSALVRLTNDDHEDRSPAWSPQGGLIAWNPWPRDSRGSERHEVWVMDTLGASRRKLASTVSAPAWDPAGTAIVFSAQASGAIRLFVINADGTGLRQLTR
jgi:Tol biopolymer transport system component